MPIIGSIFLVAFIIFCCVMSYRIGFNKGHEEGAYEMEVRINAALRQARKDLFNK